MPVENRDTLPAELAAIQTLDPRSALNAILKQATARGASDLFIQPNGNHYVVSMRTLGQIRQLVVVSNEQGMQLVNLVKSSAEMDLAERRHPLDGRAGPTKLMATNLISASTPLAPIGAKIWC